MELKIPQYVKSTLKTLNDAGYEAYVVGGAVRDLLLEEKPNDYDITTNALPEQIEELFADTIPTGKVYGTITVVWHSEDGMRSELIEVTTYRKDSNYSDGRRPDKVEFGKSLEDDLLRRDFTINALAYNPEEGVIDYFRGRDDLSARVVRCIGCADNRFKEDALRMLRALRFAYKYYFDIEDKTSKAINDNYKNITKCVSKERIHDELIKLLKYANINVGREVYRNIFEEILNIKLPKFLNLFDDVLHSGYDWKFKLAKIFRLVNMKKEDVEDKLKDLKFSTEHKNLITYYFAIDKYLEDNTDFDSNPDVMTRTLRYLYEPYYDSYVKELDIYDPIREAFERNKDLPYKVSDLAITGDDVMAKGFKGEDVGKLLNICIRLVISQPSLNKKETLELFLTQEVLEGGAIV